MSGETKPELSGFLLLYKEVGPGSQSLLRGVKRLVHTMRVGHAGTLDPFASGLLPVAVGKATRLVNTIHAFPKTYEATLLLGIATDTEDLEGRVTATNTVPALSTAVVESALATFLGEQEQQPPRYSAVRTAGKRSYEHARSGIPVDPPRRTVHIHALRVLALDGPCLRFEVRCSSGTYVRSLGRDIATALGTVGHLTTLVRTAIGPLRLEQALTPEELESLAATFGIHALILPADVVLHDLHAVVLSAQETVMLRNGVLIRRDTDLPTGTPVRGYDEEGALLGILRCAEGGLAPRLLLK